MAASIERALLDPACYPHPVDRVEMHETHISWVFLAGPYAYKVKKPVALQFLDFGTLEARRHDCEEELRLNRRLAPELYLDVVEICGSPAEPRIGGTGPVIEYAVKMTRFAQEALATQLLARGALTPELVTDFARALARFHSGLPQVRNGSPSGATESALHNALENFAQIAPLVDSDEDTRALAALRDWTEHEFLTWYGELRARRDAGMVRECHGDLHLRNIVLIDGRLVPFDCIEFSAALRWNDVMSEVAFLAMDLMDRGASDLAWIFIDAYLAATGVYSSLAVLRYYLVYRAMVRAKIHLMRARQEGVTAEEGARLTQAFRGYLELARACSAAGEPALALMHGYSGSGKSRLAGALVPALGAVSLRSDVERKRLHGLSPLAASASALESGLYDAGATQATYARLAEAARAIVSAGYTALVDAAFLKGSQRRTLAQVARELRAPVILIDVQAPLAVLRERIVRRTGDPSEATLAVLERQLATAEPLDESEGLAVLAVDTADDDTPRVARALASRLRDLARQAPAGRRRPAEPRALESVSRATLRMKHRGDREMR